MAGRSTRVEGADGGARATICIDAAMARRRRVRDARCMHQPVVDSIDPEITGAFRADAEEAMRRFGTLVENAPGAPVPVSTIAVAYAGCWPAGWKPPG